MTWRDDYKTSEFAKDGFRLTGWSLLAGIAVIIVVLILSAMAVFGFGLFQRGTADFRGGTEQIEQTKGNGSYRIAAYDHFYDLCASVQNSEATIAALEQELETNPSESRVEQINASITANRANRASSINEYNADARKEDTLANFMASDLPYQLNSTDKETTCTA